MVERGGDGKMRRGEEMEKVEKVEDEKVKEEKVEEEKEKEEMVGDEKEKVEKVGDEREKEEKVGDEKEKEEMEGDEREIREGVDLVTTTPGYLCIHSCLSLPRAIPFHSTSFHIYH